MVKAAIKREQSDACISYAEREQVRCETSKVNCQLSIINCQLKKTLPIRWTSRALCFYSLKLIQFSHKKLAVIS